PYVATLSKTCVGQTSMECWKIVTRTLRCSVTQKPDHGRRCWLRICRERPTGCNTAEKCDELAPPHSITSSARCKIVSGKVIPSVLAVFTLTTSSTFTDC